MVREAIYSECNDRSKDVRRIRKEINNMGKELDSEQDKVGTYGSTFVCAKFEICRIATKIEGVRERSKDVEANCKEAIDRGCGGVVEGTEVLGRFQSEYGVSWGTEGKEGMIGCIWD